MIMSSIILLLLLLLSYLTVTRLIAIITTMICSIITVSSHNFKSLNFKLSVSNPKSKYVAYLSVLSNNSNCQGLGRKNKHEMLKTDRTQINTNGLINNSSNDEYSVKFERNNFGNRP